MADDVRWITGACAKKFLGASSGLDAFNNVEFAPVLRAYKKQKPETWFTTEGGEDSGRRDRHAGLGKRQKRPGPRSIGQVKIVTPAQRAYVWEDDWSVIGEDLGKPYYWLIAVGKRQKDSQQHDLQEVAKPILHDPDDGWRPTLDDYKVLAADLLEAERRQNIAAIHQARDDAHAHRNTIIPVELSDLAAELTEEHYAETDLQGAIVEHFSVRFFIISLHYSDGTTIPEPVLEDLASFAFDDLPEKVRWGVYEDPATTVEGYLLDPSKVICYAADLT